MGFPIVLKSNRTSGGDGVCIVSTLEDARNALFGKLQRPPLLSASSQARPDRPTRRLLLRPSILRERHVVNAQEFVPGPEATSAVACWKGTVLLPSLHLEVLQKQDAGRVASTVLRLIENADMAAATEKMAHRLELSGFHGFDFILQAETGKACLLEINPRATQVGHLTLGPGRDLPGALYAAITAQPPRPAPKTHRERHHRSISSRVDQKSSERLLCVRHTTTFLEKNLNSSEHASSGVARRALGLRKQKWKPGLCQGSPPALMMLALDRPAAVQQLRWKHLRPRQVIQANPSPESSI